MVKLETDRGKLREVLRLSDHPATPLRAHPYLQRRVCALTPPSPRGRGGIIRWHLSSPRLRFDRARTEIPIQIHDVYIGETGGHERFGQSVLCLSGPARKTEHNFAAWFQYTPYLA